MREKLQHPTTRLLAGLLLLPLLVATCGTQTAPPKLAAESATVPAPTATPTEATKAATTQATRAAPTETVTVKPAEKSTAVPPPTYTPTMTPTTAPAISPTPIPPEVMVELGKDLFQASRCASCHGESGEGVEGLGPALPGHS